MLWKVQKFWDNAWLTAGTKEAGAACASTLADSPLLGWSAGWDCACCPQQQVAGRVESRLTPTPGAGSAGASPAAVLQGELARPEVRAQVTHCTEMSGAVGA